MTTRVAFSHILLVVFLLADPVHCIYQRWQRNTNFGNPDNWVNGRSPCGNDIVVIPNHSPVVYIQTNTTIQELVLPDNGEVIFGQSTVLAFTDQPSPDCPDAQGDVEYNVVKPRLWIDPDNWCASETQTGECTTSGLLASERVPCAKDDAVFPRFKTFYVDIGVSLNITVRAVKLSKKTFTDSTDFTNYVNTDEGSRIFPSPSTGTRSSITIAGQRCDDPTGCACGNDQGALYKQICDVYKKRCERAMCKVPFQPAGACCQMCGAQFTGTVGQGFKMESFKDIFNGFVNDYNASSTIGLQLYVSKTSTGIIQAVLQDINGEASIQIANQIKADSLADALTGGHKYRLDGIQMITSHGAEHIQPTAPSRQTGKLTGGGISGIIIAIVVVLVLAVFGLLLYRNKTGKSDNILDDLKEAPRRIQRQLSRGPRLPDDVTRPNYCVEMEEGFGNPLYGDIGTALGAYSADVKPMTLVPTEIQPTFTLPDSDGGFNNPLYDTVK